MNQKILLMSFCFALLLPIAACSSAPEVQDPGLEDDAVSIAETASAEPFSGLESGSRPANASVASSAIPGESSSTPPSSAGAEEEGSSVPKTGEITFALDQTQFSEAPTVVTGTITNATNQRKTLVYGAEVQYRDGANWTTIPLSFDWADIEQVLEPGGTQEWGFPLHPDENDYPAGRYRVVLTGMNLSDEFTIGSPDA